MEDVTLTAVQRFAALVIAKESDDAGRVDQALPDLCRTYGLSLSSFKEHVAVLLKHAWLIRVSMPGKASIYQIRMAADPVALVTLATVTQLHGRDATAADRLADRLDIDPVEAAELVALIKRSAGVRSILGWLKKADDDDLLAYLGDLRARPRSSDPVPRSGPSAAPKPCAIHPDYMGGTTASGILKCPICRKNPTTKETGL